MRLSDFLEPDLVLLNLRTEGVEDTIRAFMDRLVETGRVEDPDPVLEALLRREESHSTSLGSGVALPHATVPGVERPVVAVGIAPEGVRFGAEAREPVRVFFLLLSPLAEAGTHIKLLARVVRLVRQPGFVDALVEAEDGPALVETIERVDALHV